MASSSNALSCQKAPQRKLRTIQIKKETAARAMKIEEEMGIKVRQKLLCTRIRGRQDRNKFRVRDGGLGQDGIGRAGLVLSDIIIFMMVSGLMGGLIYVMASPNRYAKMTDEEFEEDTKRSSVLGSVVTGLERTLRPDPFRTCRLAG